MRLAAILLALMVVSSFGISYGQASDGFKPSKPEVLLQLELRNSQGQLVSYIEGTKILTIRPLFLDNFLDYMPDKKTIVRDGKTYEVIQFERPTETFYKRHAMAIFALITPVNGEMTTILLMNHDAYQVEKGDTLKVKFTIIRPVD